MTAPTALAAGLHHDGSERYVENVAPNLGDVVGVWLEAPDGLGVERAWVRSVPDGEPHFVEGRSARSEGGQQWWRFELTVHNPLTHYRFLLSLDDGPMWLNGSGGWRRDVTDHHDFRLTTAAPAPRWVSGAVFYQVFPDRFAPPPDGVDPDVIPPWAEPADWADEAALTGERAMTQLYGGSLAGVEARLDHVADVGADALWVCPMFPARSNHRYDAGTFDRIDPVLGGDEALASLTAALHRRDMRIIGDLTPNHTGDGHEWFVAAQADAGSVEAGFYVFTEHPDRYETWCGTSSLPKLDHRSAELARRMYDGPDSVVGRWLAPPCSLDGWRIDVANMTGRLAGTDLNREVALAIRATVDAAGDDRYLLAEHAHDHTPEMDGRSWHGAMNYVGFTRPVWAWLGATRRDDPLFGAPEEFVAVSGRDMVASMAEVLASIPFQVSLHHHNALGTHDTPRWRSIAGSVDAMLVGAGLLFTFVGAPCFLAGDEIGMEGSDNHGARRPFPWHAPDTWDLRVLDAYRRLATLRRRHPALQRGSLRWLHADDEVVAFERAVEGERLVVWATRRAPADVTVAVPGRSAGAVTVHLGPDLAVDADGRLVVPAGDFGFGVVEVS